MAGRLKYCKQIIIIIITFAASLSQQRRYRGRRSLCVSVCHAAMLSRDCMPQCHIILGGEGNVLYPVLSSYLFIYLLIYLFIWHV